MPDQQRNPSPCVPFGIRVVNGLRRFFRGALNGVIFLVSFLAICAGIGSQLPFPDIHPVSHKLNIFENSAQNIDTLFVGSSRVYRQIDPAQFDSETARLGTPTHSFNGGLNALIMPEDGYFLEQFLAKKPARLKWVFLELNTFDLTRNDRQSRHTLRNLQWHDFPRTRTVFRELFSKFQLKKLSREKNRREAFTALTHFLPHLSLFCERLTNLGRGSELLNFERKRTAAGQVSPNGFLPAPIAGEPEVVASYARELPKFLEEPPKPKPLSETGQQHLETMLHQIRQSGAQPILIVSPTAQAMKFVPRERGQIPIFDFADPKRYPELFATENHTDAVHLTRGGSIIYTRILAETFAALQKDSRP